MSTKTLPLHLLVSLAQRDLDSAARTLGAFQQQRTQAQEQLASLVAYREEYQARMTAAGQDGMRASNLRNYQTFIDTLDGAIAQQRAALDMAEQRLHTGQLDYQTRRQKVSSYETLASRARERQFARAARVEQRDADEYAAKIVRERTEQSTR